MYQWTWTRGLDSPVDAAAAPIRMVGIPKRSKTNAAAKQVIFALAVELVDSVLWWKHWYDRLPSACWAKSVRMYHFSNILSNATATVAWLQTIFSFDTLFFRLNHLSLLRWIRNHRPWSRLVSAPAGRSRGRGRCCSAGSCWCPPHGDSSWWRGRRPTADTLSPQHSKRSTVKSRRRASADRSHQTDKDEEQLDDVCVGHRVEPPSSV